MNKLVLLLIVLTSVIKAQDLQNYQLFDKTGKKSTYKKLVNAHATKNFDEIDYCKDCDFLYEDPEVMVWTNDKNAKINHMLGTKEDFILTNYSPAK